VPANDQICPGIEVGYWFHGEDQSLEGLLLIVITSNQDDPSLQPFQVRNMVAEVAEVKHGVSGLHHGVPCLDEGLIHLLDRGGPGPSSRELDRAFPPKMMVSADPIHRHRRTFMPEKYCHLSTTRAGRSGVCSRQSDSWQELEPMIFHSSRQWYFRRRDILVSEQPEGHRPWDDWS